MTFGAKTTVTTAALVAVLAVMGWFSLYQIGSLNDAFEQTATNTARKIELVGKIDSAKSNMAAGQRAVVLFSYAKNPAELAAGNQLYQENQSALRAALAELRPLLTTDRGKEVTNQLETTIAAWTSSYPELERLAEQGDSEGASRLLVEKVRPLYIAAGRDCQELVELADRVLQGDVALSRDRFSSSRWITILLIAFGVAAAIASLFGLRSATRIIRQIATEMLEGSRQVASASGQVASASQSLAQGTSEQAATLEETSSSTTEITAITRKNAENTQTVAGLMTETSQLVDSANQNLEEMVLSMNEINSSSEKISKIIRVIDEIAFQTNILALNAAVEAARAGEAGMGFAVVADEVRNLAHRSAQAAKDTAALIEESIGKSHDGSRKLGQVATSIQQITGSSTKVKILVDEIKVGSQEQSRGIEQIATAVGQMEQVTQRSAANAEESAAASEELAAQAQGLYAIVERLRSVMGSDQTAVAPPPTAPPQRFSGDSTRDIAALGGALRSATPLIRSPAPVLRDNRSSFPLDDNEDGF